MKHGVIITVGIAAGAAAGALSETMYSIISRRGTRSLEAAVKIVDKSQSSKYTGLFESVDDKVKKACEALRCTPMKKVYITSFDGLRLAGHFWEAENPKRLIVMAHGWRGKWWQDCGYSAQFFHDIGCSILYIEQRAHGESEGDRMDFGVTERFDIARWVDAAARHMNPQGLPIYLCGVSMGAAAALMSATLPAVENNVRGIVADCGYTSAIGVIREVFDDLTGGWGRMSAALADGAFRFHTGRSYREANTVRVMERCRVPVLFIHGGADSFVPVEMSRRNYAACAAKGKELFIVPGADHCMSYVVDMEGYQRRVAGFFRKNE